MKGNIFIGWCKDNELAVKVGEMLEHLDYQYMIGGNHSQGDEDAYIGGTIIKQLKSCNQAIFIISKNEAGYISNNIIFEIGFSFSKYNSVTKKTHLFYIDIEPKDDCIPSDLLGAWAQHIHSKNKSKEDLAQEIINSFLSNQKIDIKGNKMDLVNSWFVMDDCISHHYSNPKYSDYELAQYLLFYAVSSGLLDVFQKMEDNITLLKKNVSEESMELYYSLSLTEIVHDVALSNIRVGNITYIEDSVYLDAVTKLKKIIKKIEEYDGTGFEKNHVVEYEFKLWFLMIAYQRWGYINMMYANNPSISQEECEEVYNEAINYSKITIELCEYLKKINSKDNRELVIQYMAFCNRNISIAYKYFGDLENEKKYKLRSFEEQKFLRDYYKNMNLDARLWERFERGYYLSMAEIIKFVDSPMQKRIYLKEINAYTDYMLTVRDSSNMYINRIKLMLESKETDGL